MNNDDRREWVLNDEGLYRWWKSERTSMVKFLKEHRSELDEYINQQLNKKPSR
jgi:aspartate/tyrosine/aromatic aminotransferase